MQRNDGHVYLALLSKDHSDSASLLSKEHALILSASLLINFILMNVLWLAAYPHPIRDIQTHPVPWMTTLAQHLIEVPNLKLTIISVSPVIPKTEQFIHEGIRYIYVKIPNDKLDILTGYQERIRRVRNVLSTLNIPIDVIHIHGSELQYQVMAAKLKAPKVLSVQGIMSECLKYVPQKIDYRQLSWRLAEYYERKYLPKIENFICRTHWDTAIIKQKSPEAAIFHNWEIMRAIFYKPIQLSSKPQALLFVGGANRMKGAVELLEMYDQLFQRGLDLRLIVAGNGNMQDILMLISELKLININKERIEHRGYLDAKQLWDAYHQSLCLVHPSHIDNSPNSVCEAQLAGLPVVASNVGGISSLINDKLTGLLTPLNSKSLADAVMLLNDHSNLRQSIASKAREEALERHDIGKIVSNTCAIYSTVLNRKHSSSHVLVA